MTCNPLIDPVTGTFHGWACGSKWGMGVTTLSEKDAKEYGMDSIYGFGHDNTDPHDFSPDYESNTEDEIEAWKKAKVECPNHPPAPSVGEKP